MFCVGYVYLLAESAVFFHYSMEVPSGLISCIIQFLPHQVLQVHRVLHSSALGTDPVSTGYKKRLVTY